jgi:acyl-CoA thioester hydrolase
VGEERLSGRWFDYLVTVQPHHTDYAGVVWHGTYIAWLEEARIAAFRAIGADFYHLIELGCDLPVIELQLRYQKAVAMGQTVRVRTRLDAVEKVRLRWTQQICDLQSDTCYVIAQVVLVPVDRQQRRILRRFPPLLNGAMTQLLSIHPRSNC